MQIVLSFDVRRWRNTVAGRDLPYLCSCVFFVLESSCCHWYYSSRFPYHICMGNGACVCLHGLKKQKFSPYHDSRQLENMSQAVRIFNFTPILSTLSKSCSKYVRLPIRNQCCGSGMIYSGSCYEFLEFRILPMLFKYIWKFKRKLWSIN